jgi:hypothetical protein
MSGNTTVEIITVCCENHTKHINTLCLKNAYFNVKKVVHIVTNVLQRVVIR